MLFLETLGVIAGVVVFVLILIGISNLPDIIRSHRLAKTAKEFSLSFSPGKGIFSILSDTGTKGIERNTMSGNIGGHTVEAFDSSITVWASRGIAKKEWVLVLDGREQQDRFTRNFGLLLPSVHKIRNILKQISQN